jgi:hypothetical protein
MSYSNRTELRERLLGRSVTSDFGLWVRALGSLSGKSEEHDEGSV